MYKSLVLKFVAEPSKLMFASCKGAYFSMGLSITVWIILWMFLSMSLSTASMIVMVFFVIAHGFNRGVNMRRRTCNRFNGLVLIKQEYEHNWQSFSY